MDVALIGTVVLALAMSMMLAACNQNVLWTVDLGTLGGSDAATDLLTSGDLLGSADQGESLGDALIIDQAEVDALDGPGACAQLISCCGQLDMSQMNDCLVTAESGDQAACMSALQAYQC
jgi:hypothetical protein